MTHQQQITTFAGQAISLSDMFKFSVGKSVLDGAVKYRAELSAPDGPSTAGGKQALQHVTLVPVGEGGAARLLIGTANVVEKQAELRTFNHVDGLHRQRFKGTPFAVDAAKYGELLEAIRRFFADQKYKVSLLDAPPAPTPSPSAPSLAPVGPPSRPVGVPAIANRPGKQPPLRLIVTIAVTASAVVAAAALLLRG